MKARTARKFVLLALVALTDPACGGGGGGDGKKSSALPVTVNAVLRSTQVVPAVTPAGSGSATLVVSADRLSIAVTLNLTGLSSATTAAHLHAAQAGLNGPIMFTLSAGAFSSPLNKTLTAADFTPVPTLGINTFAQAIDAVIGGLVYVDVHTATNPGGEARGQTGGAVLAAVAFSGAQEAPTPVASAGSGSALLTLNAAQDRIDLTLSVSGISLAQVTGVHVHFGKTRAAPANNILWTVFGGPTGTFTSPAAITLTSVTLTTGFNGINGMEDAVNALLSGLLYINVHTTGNVNGEIRGQVGPAQFSASLTGTQEVPPSGSGTTGTGVVVLNASQNLVFVRLTYTSFGTTVQGAHIHAEAVGVNGPIIIDLNTPSGLTSPITGIFSVASAADVESMLTLNAYFNIHTTAFSNGEIRGQFTVP
jgi:hypothetical protein